MMTVPTNRPDPDALLRSLKRAESGPGRGKLKIFFGMCAGVGKTYEMLQAAQEAKRKGVDVVVGYVETHGRAETEALLPGLEVLPRKRVDYRGAVLGEMDLDALIARRPALALVDELAHTNAPASRHTKRYLDVAELLDNGIDVYTTLNVQHLESRADSVARISGAIVRETVPDSVFTGADEVEVIDLPPDELLKRLAEGKVYAPERSKRAIENFFRRGNLTALREMALRIAAERVEREVRDYMREERIPGPWRTGSRLVVGITPSRESVHLIRWARRLASAMQASWVAVFVETSARAGSGEKEQFARNVELARELGAEIVTTADSDVAAAIVRVAREQNATQIVVGRPGFLPFGRRTLVDRIIALSTDIDVYVAGGGREEGEAEGSRRRMPLPESGPPQYLAAGGAIVLVTLAALPFTGAIGYQTISLVYLLTVALLPLRFGIGPVVLAAGLGAAAWDYFFIPPRFTLAISKPQDILMVFTLFAVAAVTGVLTARVRARERAVLSREERAVALYTLTNELSAAKDQDGVVRAAVGNIGKFFRADAVVFLSDLDGDFVNRPHPAGTYVPDEKEMSVPAWVHWNEKRAGKFTGTLPFAAATYYPLTGPRYPLGVIGVRVRGGERFSIDQEALLHNFLGQVSSALEREFLNEMTKQSIAFVESERLYTTLFNSVSHEMRTPITALFGAAEALLDPSAPVDRGSLGKLGREIASATERLDHVVQNLLAMTRLESGLLRPKLDWTDLRDVVNAALARTEGELAGMPVAVEFAADVPLLKLDFALMEQALVNLLRNVALHTPPGTKAGITVRREGSECVLAVSDDGPGLPPDSLESIFEKFYRVPGSRAGGVGLGLSIVSGFVRAHGGSVSASNRGGGGAVFTVRLPVAPEAGKGGTDG